MNHDNVSDMLESLWKLYTESKIDRVQQAIQLHKYGHSILQADHPFETMEFGCQEAAHDFILAILHAFEKKVDTQLYSWANNFWFTSTKRLERPDGTTATKTQPELVYNSCDPVTDVRRGTEFVDEAGNTHTDTVQRSVHNEFLKRHTENRFLVTNCQRVLDASGEYVFPSEYAGTHVSVAPRLVFDNIEYSAHCVIFHSGRVTVQGIEGHYICWVRWSTGEHGEDNWFQCNDDNITKLRALPSLPPRTFKRVLTIYVQDAYRSQIKLKTESPKGIPNRYKNRFACYMNVVFQCFVSLGLLHVISSSLRRPKQGLTQRTRANFGDTTRQQEEDARIGDSAAEKASEHDGDPSTRQRPSVPYRRRRQTNEEKEQDLIYWLKKAAVSSFNVKNNVVYRIIFNRSSRADHLTHVRELLTRMKDYLLPRKTCQKICQAGNSYIDFPRYLSPRFESIIADLEERNVDHEQTTGGVATINTDFYGDREEEAQDVLEGEHLMYFAVPDSKPSKNECLIQGFAINRFFSNPFKVEGLKGFKGCEGFESGMLYCDVICGKGFGADMMCDMRSQCFLKNIRYIGLRALPHVIAYYHFQYGFYLCGESIQHDTACHAYKEKANERIVAKKNDLKQQSNAVLKTFNKNLEKATLPRDTVYEDLKVLHAPRRGVVIDPDFIETYTNDVINKVNHWDLDITDDGLPMVVSLLLPTRRIVA